MLLGKHILGGSSGPSIPIGEKWTFTSNGSWTAPANGNYKITLVGAGGKGGSGCENREVLDVDICYVCPNCGSASGGGGGAGQTVVQTHLLNRDSVLTITIGQPNSNPSKVVGAVSITANGGGTGGNARKYAPTQYEACQSRVAAGSVAANYGTGGSNGTTSNQNYQNPAGGAGKVSDYGNGYGAGGRGGHGARYGSTYGTGSNGTAGICVIEYLGR